MKMKAQVNCVWFQCEVILSFDGEDWLEGTINVVYLLMNTLIPISASYQFSFEVGKQHYCVMKQEYYKSIQL